MIVLENIRNLCEINGLRKKYYISLKEQQEFWLEQQMKGKEYSFIKYNSIRIGYCCINDNKELLQFYIIEEQSKVAQEAFSTLVKGGRIKSAYCSTFDHLALSLCSDYQKLVSCNAYLFRSYVEVENKFNGFSNHIFRQATEKDLENIKKCCEDFFENPLSQIKGKELFVLYSGELFLGAGVVQAINEFSNPYVDIGMIVAEKYRNRGVATFLVLKLKEYCLINELIPICGCWYHNYASKKTLEAAGFIAKDRILHFEF